MAIQINGRDVERLDLTYSWGVSPASASARIPGSVSVAAGTDITINLGGVTFTGIVTQNPVTEETGRFTELQLVDNRIKLMWDTVYCSFNNSEVREDDPFTPGIDRKKRFWHMLPEDWDAQIKTYTDYPYTASEIISMLFDISGLAMSWVGVFHSSMGKPVYSIDASNGSKLGNVLQEISEQLGLVFTLRGANQLVWARKGEGVVPSFPANSKDRRSGSALSNVDTAVRIVGGRNRYQDFPIVLQPDWNRGLEQFWSEPAWLREVATAFGLSGTDVASQARLAARARSVTLREYVDRRGSAYADIGLWGEVSRMEIPVWLYLRDIVWKAYRVPRSYTINGIPLTDLEMTEELLAACTFSIDSGQISLKLPREYYPEGKAFVIAQGQGLDLLDPRTQEVITSEQLAQAGTKWSAQNKFTLDTKNKVVIFEHAVFKANDLYVFPNRAKEGINSDHPLYNIAVPNAAVVVQPAAVRASLVFDAERYSKMYGSGVRKGAKHVGALNYHAIMQGGVFVEEVRYADDKGVNEKAQELAESVTAQQAVYLAGGYKRIGEIGTQLSGVIDRVSISMTFEEGLVETVEFTKERAQGNFEHEREMDRRAKSRDLFPNQKSNKLDVERLELIAKVSRENKRSAPSDYSSMADVLTRPVGAVDCSPATYRVNLPAGSVVFLGDGRLPSPSGKRFGGVVVPDGVTAESTVACATQGIVPVRVKGPFVTGDVVGCNGSDAFAKSRGSRRIGVVQASYAGEAEVLAPVQLGSSGGEYHRFQLVDIGLGRCAIMYGTLNDFVPTARNSIAAADKPVQALGVYQVAEGTTFWLVGQLNEETHIVEDAWIDVTASYPRETHTSTMIGSITNYRDLNGSITFDVLQNMKHSTWHRRCWAFGTAGHDSGDPMTWRFEDTFWAR